MSTSDEIERKFLLKSPMKQKEFADILVRGSIGKSNLTLENYDQFYIAEGTNTVRVRIKTDEALYAFHEKRSPKAEMTIKGLPSGDGLSRKEIEFEIPMERAKELKEVSLYGLEKQRTKYTCPETNLVVEFDFYLNELDYLVTAEIEYPDLDSAKNTKLPKIIEDWFTEVTGQREYSNDYLAKENLKKKNNHKKNISMKNK